MKIAIIGGGASGMILASKLNSKNVVVFEKNDKILKKFLLTGNGKCNFTNKNFDNLSKCYNNDFAKEIYKSYDNNSFIKYLNSIGVFEKEEEHKGEVYLYPNTNSSKSIFFAIYDKVISNSISIRYNSLIDDVKVAKDKFYINKELFDKVIIATGGMSYKSTGSDGKFYKIIELMGHHIIKPIPGLCALKIDNKISSILKGIRVDAKIKFAYNNRMIYEEKGELQFTDFGLSGIPVMNLSRYTNRFIDEGKDIEVSIDFTNGLSYCDFVDIASKPSYKESSYLLSGFLPNNLSDFIVKKALCDDIYKCKYVNTLNSNQYKLVYNLLSDFRLKLYGFANFDNAQVTLGGVDTDEIDVHTLESKIIKNLYFIGEVIDIDGKCGGYNLQMCYSTASLVADAINNEVGYGIKS